MKLENDLSETGAAQEIDVVRFVKRAIENTLDVAAFTFALIALGWTEGQQQGPNPRGEEKNENHYD